MLSSGTCYEFSNKHPLPSVNYDRPSSAISGPLKIMCEFVLSKFIFLPMQL